MGVTIAYHGTGTFQIRKSTLAGLTQSTMPLRIFLVELKACFCQKKWLTSCIRHTMETTFIWHENQHLTILMHGHWRRGKFSHGRWCDNSEECDWPTATMRSKQFRYIWMRKAWEWREASHVVWTRFGTRLLHSPVRCQLALWRIYSVQLKGLGQRNAKILSFKCCFHNKWTAKIKLKIPDY